MTGSTAAPATISCTTTPSSSGVMPVPARTPSSSRGAFGGDRVFDFGQGEELLEFAAPGAAGIGDLAVRRVADDTSITMEGFGSVTFVGFGGALGEADIASPEQEPVAGRGSRVGAVGK
jgi:hypothetical protein